MTIIVVLPLFLLKMDLLTTPRDTEALIGTQTFFNCSTTLGSTMIQWFYYEVGTNQTEQLVYGFDEFHGTFKERFVIERNEETRESNLVIGSVSMEDAGKFECRDNIGRGAKWSAQLSVLHAVPVCESNIKDQGMIGPNSGGIEPEELQLTCRAGYKGNQAPQLIWRLSGSNDAFTEGVVYNTVNDTLITYNLTLMANREFDGQAFVCETTKSTTVQLGCNSGPVKILGVVVSNTVHVVVYTVLGVSLLLCIVYVIYTCTLRRKKRKETKRLFSKLSEDEERLYKPTGEIQYKDTPEEVHLKTSEQENKNAIKGITILNDELFAIFENSADILVYDTKACQQNSKTIQVSRLRNPQDIASCSEQKCLYVVDQKGDAAKSHLVSIHVDPKRSQPIKKWNHIDCHGGLLSVYETKIIVCLTEKSLVNQYSANGEKLQTIQFSHEDGIDQVLCALQVEETIIVVIYYSNSSDSSSSETHTCSLCLVNWDGTIIKTITNKDTCMLKTATCMISDYEKSVLVLLKEGGETDWHHPRKNLILLFKRSLQYKRTLIANSPKEHGVKMCLDSNGSRLFVAVNSDISKTGEPSLQSGRILCYDVA